MHWFISPTLFPKSQSHSQSSVQICTILFPELQLSLCFFSSKHLLSARRCFFVFLMSSGAQVCLLQHRLWFQCSKQIIYMASSSLTSAANYIQGENHSIGKETWPRKCALQETQTSVLFYLCQIPVPCLLTRTSNDFSKSCFNVMDCCVPVKTKKKEYFSIFLYSAMFTRSFKE